MDWKWFTAGVMITVIAVAIFAWQSEEEDEPIRSVVAIVNAERIYEDELVIELKTTEGEVSRDVAIDFMIERLLLVQEAERLGFVVSDQEAATTLPDFLASQGASLEKFAAKGVSEQDLVDRLRGQRMITLLLDTTRADQMLVKFADVEARYNGSYMKTGVSFEEAEESIVAELIAEKRRKAQAEYIRALKQSADIIMLS